jgi:hypothetical protein
MASDSSAFFAQGLQSLSLRAHVGGVAGSQDVLGGRGRCALPLPHGDGNQVHDGRRDIESIIARAGRRSRTPPRWSASGSRRSS